MNRPNPFPDRFNDSEENPFCVVSSQECTGLIPSAPIEENDVDSYSEIYDTTLADDPEKAKHDFQTTPKGKGSMF